MYHREMTSQFTQTPKVDKNCVPVEYQDVVDRGSKCASYGEHSYLIIDDSGNLFDIIPKDNIAVHLNPTVKFIKVTSTCISFKGDTRSCPKYYYKEIMAIDEHGDLWLGRRPEYYYFWCPYTNTHEFKGLCRKEIDIKFKTISMRGNMSLGLTHNGEVWKTYGKYEKVNLPVKINSLKVGGYTPHGLSLDENGELWWINYELNFGKIDTSNLRFVSLSLDTYKVRLTDTNGKTHKKLFARNLIRDKIEFE